MAQFIIIVMGDDPDEDTVAVSEEMGANFVGALKQNNVRIFEATYMVVAGKGRRVSLESPVAEAIALDVQDSTLGLSSPDA